MLMVPQPRLGAGRIPFHEAEEEGDSKDAVILPLHQWPGLLRGLERRLRGHGSSTRPEVRGGAARDLPTTCARARL
jgi:hypothetical protein